MPWEEGLRLLESFVTKNHESKVDIMDQERSPYRRQRASYATILATMLTNAINSVGMHYTSLNIQILSGKVMVISSMAWQHQARHLVHTS